MTETMQDKDNRINNLKAYLSAYTLAVDELLGADTAKKVKELAREKLRIPEGKQS
ncbi:MAG: hypothetical protein L0F96_02555 [Lactococcus lactis]|nr:hypothetical protein [Lactococcus lactis]MDN5446589.1 hypothetical protein [Lactococcus lactis]MDN5473942.1 hypothetical protein [Lactococcus lactis]